MSSESLVDFINTIYIIFFSTNCIFPFFLIRAIIGDLFYVGGLNNWIQVGDLLSLFRFMRFQRLSAYTDSDVYK